ncbi:MAG: flagellar hook-associated protein FlgK [Gemmataceae bacterium]
MASTQSIGLSGILASQRLLDITGQNIANAGTDGYHRQIASLAAVNFGSDIGLGVDITRVSRSLNFGLEQSITRNIASENDLATQLDSMGQVQDNFQTGAGSLLDLLEQLRNQAVTLVGNSDDVTSQRVFINQAQSLVEKLNAAHDEISRARTDVGSTLNADVDQINSLAKQIADLNPAIAHAVIGGGNANDLSDRRDQLVNQLAQLIDVRVVPQDHGEINVFAGGVPLVVGSQSLQLQVNVDAKDQASLGTIGLPASVQVNGGAVNGLLTLRNQTLPDVLGRLNAWAGALVQTLDGAQATGLGAAGPLHLLIGDRPVNAANAPLESAGLAFPPQAGALYVSITDEATGQRTLQAVNIDPTTQSLNDVASALSAVPHLQAVVNAQSGTLTLMAQPGYAFDFAGRLPTAPETVAISGTAQAELSGNYSGTSNDQYTFTVVGSGTVGVTPNLTLEARNSAGQLLSSFNIGQGYEPGQALGPVNGVSVKLGAGTVNNGDSFGTRVIAQPDTSGILVGLGLNTFFAGDTPGALAVRSDLSAHPEQLAGSRAGRPGDGSNWRRLADLLDAPQLDSGTRSLNKFMSDLVSDVGSQVQDLDQRHTAAQSLGAGLAAQQQSVSGVDPNEELTRLVQYQRSFQMSAKFLSVTNDTLNDLFTILQ